MLLSQSMLLYVQRYTESQLQRLLKSLKQFAYSKEMRNVKFVDGLRGESHVIYRAERFPAIFINKICSLRDIQA